jgi:hypothetical protein
MALTIPPGIVGNNAVLEEHRAPRHVNDTAALAFACGIPA